MIELELDDVHNFAENEYNPYFLPSLLNFTFLRTTITYLWFRRQKFGQVISNRTPRFIRSLFLN
jgi:hypothetical protein